ncbi:MAG: lactate utilization protein [Chloroflexi bacterium]|nr:lactate utilization protein [Chloroflexota bacterium]
MDRNDFISNVSASLGRSRIPDDPGASPVRYPDLSEAIDAATHVRSETDARSSELLEEAADALATTGWNVHRAATMEDVGDLIARICQDIGAGKALRSGHEVLDEAGIGAALDRVGVELNDMTLQDEMTDGERDTRRMAHRQEVFKTDVGITGGDYVIAETGTLVIHPKKGVSRLTSLAPPVHIAVMRRGQVLPSLDELFLLEHVDIHSGDRHAAMNLISGPSRTGDIEATIVHGIHGPVETHIVLVG